MIVCLGGVANCAHRFNFLADNLQPYYRVISMDWLGRGQSGWLSDISEYCLATYVEQTKQLLLHLNLQKVILLGSSLGGIVGMQLAASRPDLVASLILNDTGPSLASVRRRRRAEALVRHHVFRNPLELLRKVGASHKHFGAVNNEVMLYIAHNLTRWLECEEGRVYRHDLRSMLAYQKESRTSIRMWNTWDELNLPILLLHGMESDALTAPTARRMSKKPKCKVVEMANVGHTPMLDTKREAEIILGWLDNPIEY